MDELNDQRRSVEFSRLPDDQALTGGLHDVDFENSLHLREEPIQQAKVATGYANDRRDLTMLKMVP
jgi:hypothetical protein